MSAVARSTDPSTSHEAAAGVDLARSQALVLTFCHRYMGPFFTDKGLVSTYHLVQNSDQPTSFPPLSDSRIRTARMELATAKHPLVFFAGHTKGAAREERMWTLDPGLAVQS